VVWEAVIRIARCPGKEKVTDWNGPTLRISAGKIECQDLAAVFNGLDQSKTYREGVMAAWDARPAMCRDLVATRAGHHGQRCDAAFHESRLTRFAAAKQCAPSRTRSTSRLPSRPQALCQDGACRIPEALGKRTWLPRGLQVDAQTYLRDCRSRTEQVQPRQAYAGSNLSKPAPRTWWIRFEWIAQHARAQPSLERLHCVGDCRPGSARLLRRCGENAEIDDAGEESHAAGRPMSRLLCFIGLNNVVRQRGFI